VQAARGAALTRRPAVLLVLVALITVALDAVTKLLVVEHLEGKRTVHVLGDALQLVVSRNSGAAFSFATGMTFVFTAVAVAVVVYVARILPRLQSLLWALALGLIVGGALGNLVDRLTRAPGFGKGAVVDFLYVPHFATFNVADSGITVGAALAILLSFRGVEVDGTRKQAE
jgi:signal peptidase II